MDAVVLIFLLVMLICSVAISIWFTDFDCVNSCLICVYSQTGTSGAIVNGVPVIDVSALEQAADSSNESSATAEPQGDTHETDPIGQASPHFITVTGMFVLLFNCKKCYFNNLQHRFASYFAWFYNIDIFL